MYIAVQVQEILLGNERVLFKPIGLIRGTYDKKEDVFIDEYDYVYKSMNGDDLYSDRYFCCPTTMNKLRGMYKGITNDTQILEEFLANVMESYFIGYYDDITGNIKLIDINSIKIEEAIANKEYDLGMEEDLFEDIELDDDGNERYVFNRASLEALRNYNSIKEVREFIDDLIETGGYIKDYLLSSDDDLEHAKEKEEFKLEWETYYTILGIEEKKYTKKQLLNIVKRCIDDIQKENLDKVEKDTRINKVLDAYNNLVSEIPKKIKKLR